ncbi:MAG TPA: glycosyl hydrolase [Bacteroidia bacterium]|nr:glycosyl hydrolase [Bacteroidia bacterium]HRH08202.1 glycosyl hydrolase [Bacteroidia bacterium]
MKLKNLLFTTVLFFAGYSSFAQTKPSATPATTERMNADAFSGLQFRNIGPAITSGRVVDIVVNPKNKSEYYVAAASGGVWKTVNSGTSYFPVFDGEASFSIACISIDPTNTNVVWVGTGENNNQRVAGYGDGIYKSEDAGKTWKNMGLKTSEHIGKICIDPRNSNIVFAAAYGPLWSAGGDRGIYKTTDGGKTWKNTLTISENTGCNEVVMDPQNSNILYATAHQRRRHEWTYISGGPESAVYKSVDAGETWNKLAGGIPEDEKGRIGIAVSPVNSDYVYIIIEGNEKSKGLYRSIDKGANWEKRGTFSTAGNYYQELFCDPKNADKVYAMDYNIMVSIDGGKNFQPIGEKNKHVDNHALWIDDSNVNHILSGCDGGIYESYDGAKTWDFKDNLPITQFYRVCTDNDYPFYNVYGGTQDNFSLGGPSRTKNASGIVNSDWFVTNGGDGFFSKVDPTDPNVVYAESQYGGLIRFDKKSGEAVDIKPVEKEGEAAYRWNWDAPLHISNFSNTRLYFAANRLFKSDDRGNTWTTISPDLSRQLDRNKLPVMGKVWSVDAIAKNASTSIYGNIISFSESAKNEKLLYVGTDDGLVQTTADGGTTWTKTATFAGVPERSPVSALVASQHNEKLVYAAFNNHRNGDFKPYLMKSTDAGKTWMSITSNLPARGSVYSFAEDHVNANLLFVGTEFGLFFSNDGGQKWIQLKGGLPTIAIRDIAIQKREDDLVLASFGRGFYILDNYSLLRTVKKEDLEKPITLFPVKNALMYVEAQPLGHRGKGFRSESFFSSPNPALGAVFTYYLADNLKNLKQKRKDLEKEKIKKGENVYYPSMDSLRMEDREDEVSLIFTITDEKNKVIRRLKEPAKKGMHRLVWDMRHTPLEPISFRVRDEDNLYDEPNYGHMVMPGTYYVSVAKVENGNVSQLVQPMAFTCVALNAGTFPVTDRAALEAFYMKVSELSRVASAADNLRDELVNKVKYLKAAILDSPKSPIELLNEVKRIENGLKDIQVKLNGDASLTKREFEALPGINSRIGNMQYSLWRSTQAPTETNKESFALAAKLFAPIPDELKALEASILKIEKQLEQDGAPHTPGREFNWKK